MLEPSLTHTNPQTLSTTYACEVVPTVLRPYLTAYVCMCWGGGILLSSGVVRAVASIQGELAWKLPFMLQWVWPVPLFIGTYFAPESPWNSVRRNRLAEARESLIRLRQDTPDREIEVDAALAYIRHTTALEQEESSGASFWECFQGTNLRRTEIVRLLCFITPLLSPLFPCWVPAMEHNEERRLLTVMTSELRGLGRPDPLRQCNPRLFGCLPRGGRLQ